RHRIITTVRCADKRGDQLCELLARPVIKPVVHRAHGGGNHRMRALRLIAPLLACQPCDPFHCARRVACGRVARGVVAPCDVDGVWKMSDHQLSAFEGRCGWRWWGGPCPGRPVVSAFTGRGARCTGARTRATTRATPGQE